MKLPLYCRKDSIERGRHLVATCDIVQNQLLFVERPLLALQSLMNMQTNLVCHYCLAPCGNQDSTWGMASGRTLRNQVTLQKEDNDMVACPQDCGQVYCSEACQQDDKRAGHLLLCTGTIMDDDNNNNNDEQEKSLHPLLQFKIHALQHNEVFLVVANAIVRILMLWNHHDENHDDSFASSLMDFTQVPWWQVVATQSLMTNTSMGMKSQPDKTLDTTLQQLCHESSTFLKQALLQQLQQQQQQLHNTINVSLLEQLCTVEWFGKMIGTLEQNVIGIVQQNQLCHEVFYQENRIQHRKDLIMCLQKAGIIDSNEQKSTWNDNNEIAQIVMVAELLLSSITEESTNDIKLWNHVFVPLDGMALYATACKMNHSCQPNVAILYRPQEPHMPLVAYCVATRDIPEGQELCISYIDSNEPLSLRREACANYGFYCQCEKCVREEMEDANEIVPSIDAESNVLDEHDLFGSSDNDDDESEEDNESNDGSQDTVDGEVLLQRKCQQLDKARNKAAMNILPVNVVGIACNCVIRLGSAAVQEIPNELQPLLKQCLNAVRERDFVQCAKVGAIFETQLYNILSQHGSCPDSAYRQAYGAAALTCSIGNVHVGSLLKAQAMLDKAFILGVPRDEIGNFFSLVEYFASQAACGPCPPAVSCQVDNAMGFLGDGVSDPLEYSIPEASPDIVLDEFESLYVSRAESVVFRGFASDWAATEKWRNLNTLVYDHGHRLVPIELGTMMESGGMKEQIVTFRTFVSTFLVPSSHKIFWTLADATDASSSVAYLAQHPLLDQIPALCHDIIMSPRLCSSPPLRRNVWMGTGGTRTPLHYDSYDNLLVQIVGYKYVRVYDTSETENLYVIRGGSNGDVYAQGNMSAVNCELEDLDKHPLARNANYKEVYLGPGDCVFLPARMWHYVRSLSTSISVNYWW